MVNQRIIVENPLKDQKHLLETFTTQFTPLVIIVESRDAFKGSELSLRHFHHSVHAISLHTTPFVQS